MKQIGSEYISSPATLDTSGRGAPSEFPPLELNGDQQAQHVDVLIVGAGLSGIGAAYSLKAHCPTKSFAILEQRNAIGGTWDLFRYPGVRSDSDMFTLGYSFRPWKEAESIADGPSIRSYIHETADEYGVRDAVRFNQKVVAAAWSSEDA